ncbi:ABC transporter ATP-binding protein [Tepidiforma sp.]|uniref:ABC transporter ATP-binding protein n=1 Tax=Tepidiforma sp. TaxID=2682230 RepID=UPI002ADD74E4|nr:ABC transporter ATP-binding protein [Tepidiforma sp.]
MRGLAADFALRAGSFSLEVHVEAGPGITVLFGPSGSGKSLTLRAIAGLTRPRSGRVTFDDTVLFDRSAGIDCPPHRRRLGFAGQHPALLPFLDVAGNVAFGLRGIPRAERATRVRQWLERVGLPGFESRRVGTLSGGQAQRIALARALAPGHRLLLLDEPFSALDESLRQGLRAILRRLATEQELTILFVTHDLREAHLLADQLVVLDGGTILQCGQRETVFRAPANRRVALLLGAVNVFPGVVRARDGQNLLVESHGLVLRARSSAGDPAPGDPVDLTIRPERVIVRRSDPGINAFPARVAEDLDYGAAHTLVFEPLAAGPRLTCELAARPYDVLGIAAAGEWTIELPPEHLHVMPAAPPT